MIRLRLATPADIEVLTRWDAQPHVIAATGDDDVIDWRAEVVAQSPVQETLLGELDSRPIGVVQIIDPAEEPTHYWGEVPSGLRAIDIWIGEATDLGRGYGTQMMRQALDRCFEPPLVTATLIDPLVSNVRALRFYRRFGFVSIGRQTFGTDECLVHRLGRTTWINTRGRRVLTTMEEGQADVT